MQEVFPPALVPVLRDRYPSCECLAAVTDEVLVELLTTVFFAGLETYESERNPIRVVLLGDRPAELVVPGQAEAGAAPMYRWKIMRFVKPRRFDIAELVKLAVGSVDARIYTAVHVDAAGGLAIVGLASEGLNAEADPFVEVIAARPGSLSIRSGRDRLVEYDRGIIQAGAADVVDAATPVREALEAMARSAGLEEEDLPDYLDAVRALVREMSAHGHGGILVIHREDHPAIAASSPYRMMLDSSPAALLRLARRVARGEGAPPSSSRRSLRYFHDDGDEPRVSFRSVLRSAFLREAERVIEELGALTGVDGATVLNHGLALVAFGVILPVGEGTAVSDVLADGSRPAIDLTSRGTRHRASATYAAQHPGCVVFVASEDGQVTCLVRNPAEDRVLLWHLGAGEMKVA
jgi:hypothetical protein